jgi:lipoprotein-releasing system permease protein
MSLPFFIAKKHIFSRHKISYVSFVSTISIVGLAIGVAALILTISILNGFERELKTKLIDFDAHIRLRVLNSETLDSTDVIEEKLSKIEEIRHIVPYIHNYVMIRHGNEVDGVIVEGISEKDIKKTLNVDRFIKSGSLNFKSEDNKDGVVIGQKLADYLNVDLYDKVYLFVMKGTQGFGNRPRIKTFIVKGIYDSGVSDYDDIYIYTSLAAAQDLFNFGSKFSGYQIVVNNPEDADQICSIINETLGYPFYAISWKDLHSNLFEWLDVQRFPIMILFGLIAVVAIFNIISSLTMIVIEKTKDIGILKSMGVNKKQITKIFVLEGFFIGLIGTLLGYLLALTLGWIQSHYGIISIPADVYFMSELPILSSWEDFLFIGVGALVLSLIATIYPSVKANKLSPVEATRYE